MILNEIGLELEVWLLDKNNNILEPSIFGFPSDEMGFLIELRSEHSNNVNHVIESLDTLLKINREKAKSLGYQLKILPYMNVSKEFQEYISKKYRHDSLPDYTKNIYNTNLSHHTGFLNDMATAGLHVHFSRREIEKNCSKLLKLPVRSIVFNMDQQFKDIINDTNRILGEYEPKTHGFEYRSLPSNCSIKEVATISFKILEEV
jgi:hypothetical protein